MSSCTVSGTPTHDCSYGNERECDEDGCCIWTIGCAPVACNTLSNPDECVGCNTCPGIWYVTDHRTLPWIVNVSSYVRCASGGYFRCASGKYVKII